MRERCMSVLDIVINPFCYNVFIYFKRPLRKKER